MVQVNEKKHGLFHLSVTQTFVIVMAAGCDLLSGVNTVIDHTDQQRELFTGSQVFCVQVPAEITEIMELMVTETFCCSSVTCWSPQLHLGFSSSLRAPGV